MNTLPFLLGSIVGATVAALIVAARYSRDAVIRDMRRTIKRLKAECQKSALCEAETLKVATDWRLCALNSASGLQALRQIKSNPICRHEVEAQLGDEIWDALSVPELGKVA